MARTVFSLATSAWCIAAVGLLALARPEHLPNVVRQSQHAGDKVQYEFNANGKPARVAERWDLRRSGNQDFGILLSIVRCGNDVFLSDTQGHVFRFDASAKSALSLFAGEGVALHFPSALAADCSAGVHYVVDVSGPGRVVALRFLDGSVVRTYDVSIEQLTAVRSACLMAPESLYIAGVYWTSKALVRPRTTTVSTFYPDVPIGHDQANLYIVTYGDGNRQPAVASAQLLRVPVKQGQESYIQ